MPLFYCLIEFDGEAIAPKELIYAFNSFRTKVRSLELGTWEPNESWALSRGLAL